MNTPDELDELWATQPVEPAVKGEEMRQIVLQKIDKFDRIIRRRNLVESAAALVVVAFFACAAWWQHNGIERLGSLIIVAAALWIIYYLRRHGAEPPEASPDQSLAGYQRALIVKYDHQIRLLRGVKFWYLLPLYAGLATQSAGLLKERAEKGSLTWTDAIFPALYTLFFAFVWWLNEVHTVRRLERMRAKMASGMADRGSEC
jgi:hypothetical protein